MAMTWYEHHDTNASVWTRTTRSVTRRFFVQGTDSREEVEAASVANTPEFLGDLIRSEIRLTNERGGNWSVEVVYSNPTQAGADPLGSSDPASSGAGGGRDGGRDNELVQPRVDSETETQDGVTFETTAQTTKITQAITTRWIATSDGRAKQNVPAFGNAIGVTEDRVEGTEIYAPTFTFTIPHRVPRLKWGFLFNVHFLTGKINEKPFFAFPENDVLYLGCTGQFNGNGFWNLSHKFAVSLSEQNVKISPDITVPNISGWDHVWVRYKQALVDGVLLPVPDVAYVQQVYQVGDFSLLGIGG